MLILCNKCPWIGKNLFFNKKNFMVTLLYHVIKLKDKKDMILRITKRKWLNLF